MSTYQSKDYIQFIDRLWQRQVEFTELLEYSNELENSGLRSLVAVLYQTWVQRHPSSTYNSYAFFNLGVLLFNNGDIESAGNAYEQALTLNPHFVQPRFNLGLVHERQGRIEAALEQWQLVQKYADPEKNEERPVLIAALNNQARVQEQRKQFGDAMQALNRSLALNPHQNDVLHHWIFIKAKQCLWPVYAPPDGVSEDQLRECTSALALLSLSDDPKAQLDTAIRYIQKKIPADLPKISPDGGYPNHKKIRIGYCSSDFCLHPVAMLTVELLELHDREKFEIYGFCWSPNDDSELRKRIIKAFDRHIPIGHLDEKSSAELIRSHEIDILIDLQGQTAGARLHMLAMHPAPIQITYLGLPATTGIPGIDYVIADKFLIPEIYAKYYSEKPIYLPDVYQASDTQRKNNKPLPKKDYNLPSKKFIFCSFNNNYKYTPEIFSCWMRILKKTPNSILWLLADNPWAEENLKKLAQEMGIDPNRIIFTQRSSPEDYLAKYLRADLFLDTFPFNAGTTANDALWMGVPVLTLTGRSFASRMAGSLLTAANLPELITTNLEDYENLAISLCKNKDLFLAIKEKTKNIKEKTPLFKINQFTKNFESCLENTLKEFLENNKPRKYCICCNQHVKKFLPYRNGTLPHAMQLLKINGSDIQNFSCPSCSSTDRERHLYIYIQSIKNLIKENIRVLHFAPEKNLTRLISSFNPEIHIFADIHTNDPRHEKINIENIPYSDNSFDLIIANHILEHVDDVEKSLKEINRTLKPEGIAILQTPYSLVLNTTWQDTGINSDQLRNEFYGQEDRVRIFGRDIFEKFAAILEPAVIHHQNIFSNEVAEIFGVNATEPFFLYRKKISLEQQKKSPIHTKTDTHKTPLVSVICMSYNHEKFIEKSINSFTSQETDFNFEIIIGDDASSDNTKNLIEKFSSQKNYTIQKIFNPQNIGMQRNLANLFKEAKGKYIAFCEGDDYWTDTQKLQKQVDFLEKNPSYSLTYSSVISHKIDQIPIIDYSYVGGHKKDLSNEELMHWSPLNTLTTMFRKPFPELPPEQLIAGASDLFIWSLLGNYGHGHYMENILPSIYNQHSGGIFSSKSEEKRKVLLVMTCYALFLYNKRVENFNLMDFYLNGCKKFIEEILNSSDQEAKEELLALPEKIKLMAGETFNPDVLEIKKLLHKDF